jgi:uncharacterized membrane protein YeaQ/YmgE (transglycosylase-associated protein family)
VAIIIWLVIGAAIGFVAGIVVHAAPMRRFAYVILGAAAAIGGGLAAGREREAWDSTALIVAALAAILLVAIVNLFRRSPAG